MSSSVDTGDTVSVRDGGVSVKKQYAPDEFPIPAIRFEIESDCEDPVSIRLTESIPESFPMDSIGFHPDYHSDQWSAYSDHRVQFTGTVEPDSPLVTVYGIRHDKEFDPTSFLSEPTITKNPTDDSAGSSPSKLSDSVNEIVSSGRTDAVKDVLAGNRDSIPGLDSDSGDSIDPGSNASDDTAPDIELDIDGAAERVTAETSATDGVPSSQTPDEEPDSNDSEGHGRDDDDSESPSPRSGESGRDSLTRTTAPQSDETVASQLAAEIRSGSVAESDLRTIFDAPGTEDASGATEAKLAHLQERVDDLSAYTGALESFLEEEGTGVQLIEEFRTELDQLRTDLSAVAEVVEEHDSTLSALDDRVSSVESSVPDLEERTDSI